ncbi:copper resistance CopC family protein [Marinobacterium sp. YM272]|uniref:copper resistance CopC family protein n=1 Tax=Marinobacterium sp. YM272 TaxID=3421654 RepID=UPI003D7F7B0C
MKPLLKSLFPALFLTLAALVAAPVSAHSMLAKSQPADGALMQEKVDELVLEFGQPVRLLRVDLTKAEGAPIDIDFIPSIGPGTTFDVAVPELAPGDYKVHWMLMGEDGHKVTGSFGFSQR